MPPQTDDEVAMYLIARADLKMSPGKLAAQVGHGVQYTIAKIAQLRTLNIGAEYVKWYADWEAASSTKIVLRVESRDQLIELYDSMQIPRAIVRDEGRTEITATETVVSIVPVPRSVARPFIGKLPLYR
jgi:peptidyl-tRNA hydrolase